MDTTPTIESDEPRAERALAHVSEVPAGPNVLVIFGGSGDLTKRKLLPALRNLARDRLLPEQFAILAISRTRLSDGEFRQRIASELLDPDASPPEVEAWHWLEQRLFYLPGDLDQAATYVSLRERLAAIDRDFGTSGNYLFYLATAPEHFAPAVRQLAAAELTTEKNGQWRHVIIEKPLGRDLASARQLDQELAQVLHERQVYRIDHYLGKETVQNIIVFRFANGVFEPLWNRRYVDHVQITVTETLGVEGRGDYYDESGALRDMIPSHLFQLLSLIAMEPPASMDADAIRDEQVKVLRSIRPLGLKEEDCTVVRGQYGPGRIGGELVPGYREEPRVATDSHTETFVALKLHIDNWRWADVPFYLRTGKRLDRRRSEIVVQYRRAPHLLFRQTEITTCLANQLVLHVQPEEGVSLSFGAKIPGPVVRLGTVAMDFDYLRTFGNRPSTGYERLLYDCMTGDQTLFQRADMVELAWSVVAPVQAAWKTGDGLASYPAGSHGPVEADKLLSQDGRKWREDSDCG